MVGIESAGNIVLELKLINIEPMVERPSPAPAS